MSDLYARGVETRTGTGIEAGADPEGIDYGNYHQYPSYIAGTDRFIFPGSPPGDTAALAAVIDHRVRLL